MKELVLEFILSPTKKMTKLTIMHTLNTNNILDSLIKELKECKDNQKCEQLLQSINHCQRDIQTLYDNGDFDLELSANEPVLISDGEYTDEQMRLDMEFANQFISENNNDNINYDFDSDTPMF